MATIFCQKITRKKIDVAAAYTAWLRFDPKKVFDWHMRRFALHTARRIERPYHPSKISTKGLSCLAIGDEIEVFHFLANNPVRHGIDIIANDIAAQPVGFQ
jgi:hypothetical protein